jgi:glyoxylase-like metal-dependent hydrolase (beta-lactamase superfamily II)
MIKAHHLNCSMPETKLMELHTLKRQMCCHCLLLETDSGLALIDTGVSKDFVQKSFRKYLLKKSDEPIRTLSSEIRNAGFDPKDVRTIFITHIDHDHVGGLTDFPWANVYIHINEMEFTKKIQSSIKLRLRFQPQIWRSSQIHCLGESGDQWYGFESVKAPANFSDEILMIPLFGHTPGHSGYAIKSKDGWLLHAGDAFYSKDDLAVSIADRSLISEALATFLAVDQEKRILNLERLRILSRKYPQHRVINSHDPVYFGE